MTRSRRSPIGRGRLPLVSAAVLALACAGSCTPCDPAESACTPDAFDLAGVVSEDPDVYSAPGGCSFAPVDAKITNENEFQDALRCPDTTVVTSGVDFTAEHLFVVAVENAARAQVEFVARDGNTLHVGATRSIACKDGASLELAVALRVKPDDDVVVHACVDTSPCPSCG